jgi:hypothetical protein
MRNKDYMQNGFRLVREHGENFGEQKVGKGKLLVAPHCPPFKGKEDL